MITEYEDKEKEMMTILYSNNNSKDKIINYYKKKRLYYSKSTEITLFLVKLMSELSKFEKKIKKN